MKEPAASPAVEEPETASPPASSPPSDPPESDASSSGDQSARDLTGEPGPAAAWTLLVFSLLWLAGTLLAVQGSLGATDQSGAVSTAALALPTVIAASLLAGAAAGLATVRLLAGWLGAAVASRTFPRLGASVATGMLTGMVVAGIILAKYGSTAPIVMIALAVGAAGAFGGALAGLRPGVMIAAGLSGTLGAFVTGSVLDILQSPILKIIGSTSSPAANYSSRSWYALVAAAVGGIVAGLAAFAYLRRTTAAPRWQGYAVAGGMAGGLLLLAELVTRVGGRQLLAAAGATSEIDRFGQQLAGTSRLNGAMLVLFAGAVAAIIALGRTLPRRR